MISENKLKHMIGVARECERLAAEAGLPEEQQQACFIMGWLHDIGYEWCPKEKITEHGEMSFDAVKSFEMMGNQPLLAILNHGLIHEEKRMSMYDQILNTADLTIDHVGNKVTVEERLMSIKKRHGENSDHYHHAMAQAQALGFVKGNAL